MTRYLRGVEFADRASDSRYPLIPLATATDRAGVFSLPNDFLVAIYLSLPADLPISPGYVFISRVINTPGLITLAVSASISGELVEIGQFDVSRQQTQAQIDRIGYGFVVFEGTDSFKDLRGRATIRSLATIAEQPQGEFFFDYDDAGIEPDCIRPHLRHVAALEVEQPGGSLRLGGVVRLAAGNNMRLRVEVIDDQPTVFMDALDASQLNEDLECETGVSPPIRRINGIEGDSQRQVTLIGSRCLEVNALAAEIQLRNRCSEPCASCQEAEQVQSLLEPFASQVPTLIGLANRLDIAVTQTQLNVISSRGDQRECSGGENV